MIDDARLGVDGLRVTLIVITSLAAVAWLGLAVVADRFRRSFGASTQVLTTVGPIVLLVLLLSGLIWSGIPAHIGAVVAGGLLLGGLALLPRHPGTGLTFALYAGLWLACYGLFGS